MIDNRRMGIINFSNKEKTIIIQILFAILSFIICIYTLTLPSTAFNYNQLERMPFGWPFPFIYQNIMRLDPPEYPKSFVLQLPHEYPETYNLGNFALSMLFYILFLNIVYYLYKHLSIYIKDNSSNL